MHLRGKKKQVKFVLFICKLLSFHHVMSIKIVEMFYILNLCGLECILHSQHIVIHMSHHISSVQWLFTGRHNSEGLN